MPFIPRPVRARRAIRLLRREVIVCAGLVLVTGIVVQAQLGAPAQPPPPPARGVTNNASPAGAELGSAMRVQLEAAPVAQAGIANGTAYVPLREGRLVAVDLELGRVRWSIDLATPLQPVAGGELVFVAGDEMLTALRPDASVAWRLPVPGGFTAPPAFAAGWLFVGASSGDVLCLRASDGQVLWTAHVGAALQPGVSVAGDRVYLGLEDGTVWARELQTGKEVWQHKLPAATSPILALDDRIFVGSHDKFFYCLDPKDGDQRWRWRTGGTIVGVPAVDDDHVYFVAFDNVLRALDRRNGTQRWKAGLPLRPSGGPLLIGPFVAVAGVSAEIYTYVAATSKEASHYHTPADLAAAPQVLPGPIPELSAVLLLSREGILELLRRRLEPAIVPFDHPIGAPIPLDAPPPPPPLTAG